MARAGLSACLLLAVLAPLSAGARDTDRMLPASGAVESEDAKGYLLDLPFHLKGDPAAPSGRKLSTISTQQTSNGAFRSDARACNIAFLTALRRLQERARQAGADAVVDVVSVTQDQRTEHPIDFRCVAGTLVVHVGLEGTAIAVEK